MSVIADTEIRCGATVIRVWLLDTGELVTELTALLGPTSPHPGLLAPEVRAGIREDLNEWRRAWLAHHRGPA